MQFSLLILILLFMSCFQTSYSRPQRYTSIFSFGDSLYDTGNLILTGGDLEIPNPGALPYGMTFGRPTGRCSDGRLIIDFIAEAFGLPLLPPSLARGQSFQQGANFAVAGATALDVEFFRQRGFGDLVFTNDSLSVQLRWFEELKPSLCNTTKDADCKEYFSKSLFMVGEIGDNDYGIPIFARRGFKEVKSYVPKVIETISTATERLIDHGAMELVVPGSFPLGCVGRFLTMYMSPSKYDYDPRTGCLKKLNGLSRYHNALLRRELEQLRSKYPQARIIYADYYGAAMRLMRSPERHGFFNGALRACCGGGGPYNSNETRLCGQPGSTVCEDPSTYVSWDGSHLTEAAYNSIATGVLYGPCSQPPLVSALESARAIDGFKK